MSDIHVVDAYAEDWILVLQFVRTYSTMKKHHTFQKEEIWQPESFSRNSDPLEGMCFEILSKNERKQGI